MCLPWSVSCPHTLPLSLVFHQPQLTTEWAHQLLCKVGWENTKSATTIPHRFAPDGQMDVAPPSRFHAHDNNVWGGNPYIQIHLHCCNWEARPRFKPPSRDWLEVCRWVSLCRWPYSCWSPHHIVVAGGGRPSRGVYKTVQSRVHEQCISGGFSCIEPSSIL